MTHGRVIMTPGIKPEAFGYNVKVVLFETCG